MGWVDGRILLQINEDYLLHDVDAQAMDGILGM